MIATATYYLPLARVGSHCVDAVKFQATWLGQSATLINVCYREREREREGERDEDEERQKKKEDPKAQRQGTRDQRAAL